VLSQQTSVQADLADPLWADERPRTPRGPAALERGKPIFLLVETL
jgi:hypothetical protein